MSGPIGGRARLPETGVDEVRVRVERLDLDAARLRRNPGPDEAGRR
ncbi:hypothetical protein V1634_15075 [Plantactinospora veratri]|uniref:Uncharacterized protein n=1 Tax=Plantactinospora veratri TaxID=1436122 RepID=A0ABU7SDX5_9ACTN